MTTLYNEITINAPIEKIWEALSNIEALEKFDPTVKKSTAISPAKNGIDSKRKVTMQDGKNWFEEQCTVWKQNQALTYELTACSFPVHKLKHSYNFEKTGTHIKVKQVMAYQIKFGFFGKILDALVIRKQSDTGVKRFFAGLKKYSEN